ncbi:16S rRNA (uracil(1498)-N(3))-methyltransferase [soil metagenome]
MRRFYATPDSFSNGQVTLGFEETRHLRDVLRLRSGDSISVFDGAGLEYLCRVAEISKKTSVGAIVKSISPPSPESPLRLTLAAAILKGDKFDLVIQKAVELGISRLVPLQTIRCEARITDSSNRLERWRRIRLEATKQSGRATLMEILEAKTVDEIFSLSPSDHMIMFSERNGGPISAITSGDTMTAIVGPEGGWDDSELDAAASAKIPIVTLGGRILRAETAAIAVSAILQNRFGDLN